MQQGINGFVGQIRGNQMPSPDVPPAAPTGISTTVFVYEATNISQVVRVGTSSFYQSVNSRFIDSVVSDNKGNFMIALPTGTYSLFVKLNGQFYANSFDSKNFISPVTVEENKLSQARLIIRSNTVY